MTIIRYSLIALGIEKAVVLGISLLNTQGVNTGLIEGVNKALDSKLLEIAQFFIGQF